jgi:cellulose synthase/poly-beta-1,6-N-acetylglucosamine synthase-like glycosyltransferase
VIIATILFVALAVPAVPTCLYLFALTLLSRTPPLPPRPSKRLCFDVVVPAHNEAVSIAAVIESVQSVDWPRDCYRVVVVADNCDDDTAAIARGAGAHVLERRDDARRGKGYALEFAFRDSVDRQWADAIVVIDADSTVSANLLAAFAARIERGEAVAQAHYGVSNPDASWRTRLMAVALGAFHGVRSRARERLGLSCGIRGNGWCITPALLRRVPYTAYSLAEDVEYGIELGLAGHRVCWVDEATVAATMVTSERAARSQRRRWESGRWQLLRSRTSDLLAAAIARRDVVCLDLAIDLWIPPLAYAVTNVVALMAVLAIASPAAPQIGWSIAIACAGCIAAYVVRGWQLSGTGARALFDLVRAPVYVVWKLALMARSSGPSQWVRTQREDA